MSSKCINYNKKCQPDGALNFYLKNKKKSFPKNDLFKTQILYLLISKKEVIFHKSLFKNLAVFLVKKAENGDKSLVFQLLLGIKHSEM